VNHSGFAASRGRVKSRPLSACGLVFVTVNEARAAPEASSVTFSLAAVTVKLGAPFGADKRSASDPDGDHEDHDEGDEHDDQELLSTHG
jgi:hypothetical protein